jgi:hypothetical protein
MIWERKSVVTLGVIEKRILEVPVPQYWPKKVGGIVKFWNLQIKTTKIEDFGDFLLSMLEVTNLKVK